ncbi:MAG TPA: redoxin domain-containing protein [Acidimicrobiales bacterium]|nr:redoxin domain-containing protein [Acidimicrobiales bacterium]
MAPPVPAPELAGRGGWIGVEEPLSMERLRGRVVVLHFLRFSAVGCLRVIEELRPLERLFAEEMVVVGVHSPGYAHETEHRSVRSGVGRHRVGHPVLDDPELETARAYGVGSWPTVVVVDPAGDVVETLETDSVRIPLEKTIPALVEEHERRGSLRREPLFVHREILPVPLAYPAKVAVSPDGRRLAIADPSYDQVLVCTLDGLVLEVHSGFSQPHGVRFDEDGDLALCDTAAGRVVRASGEVLADAMCWPWDLVADKLGMWVVAEAGHNRILRIKPSELRARVAAGTGAFGVADGILAKAEMAQPSGVARSGEGIVFVDTEPGSLRLMGPEVVSTLVADGLEHPLAVASDGDELVYVADTFNSVIKVWEEGGLRTLPVEGLDEPGGLDVLPDGHLVVADTNNHRVVVVDPASGAVAPLELDDTWVHAGEGDAMRSARGAKVEVPWRIDLVGEELEGARRSPVRVTLTASPPALLENGPVSWSGASAEGVVAGVAGGPGSGMLLVEVSADVRQGARRRLRRVNRFRYPFDVR